MPKNQPGFVRLNEVLAPQGSLSDVDSGWSIGGYDVQPYPEDEAEATFVRSRLRAGVLEVASQAEFDEAHGEDDDLVEIKREVKIEVPYQEGQVREAAKASRARLMEARGKQTARASAGEYEEAGSEEDGQPLSGITPLTAKEKRDAAKAERKAAKESEEEQPSE